MSAFIELFLPLIVSNVLHMFVVKYDGLPELKVPVSTRLFGANKTWRGFVFVGVVTACCQVALNGFLFGSDVFSSFSLGLVLGLTYMCCELPNSFVKRRLGIGAGARAEHRAWLFVIMDKCDSTLGVCLVFVIYKGLPVTTFIQLFVAAFAIHLSLSKALQMLRVKESL
ncbi:MAG: CDP-archaeol synthase [Bradymonadia bacterium]